MAFLDFDTFLTKTNKGSKLREYAAIFKILQFAKEYICDNFSQNIAEQLSPEKFKNGVLAISAKSAPAASELKLHEKALIDFLEKNTGINIVKRIKISI